MAILTNRATDIYLNNAQLCEAMGYLATPGRMRIEAQVPNGKERIFENEYPGQMYDRMLPTSDKQSFQLRIMMKNTANCPDYLRSEITAGGGNHLRRLRSCQKPGKLSMAKRSDLSVSGHEIRQYEVQCGFCSNHGRDLRNFCCSSVPAKP